MQQQEPYPVRFSVDYPDRPLDRLTTGFRIFVAIPIVIVLGGVSGGGEWQWDSGNADAAAAGAGGLLFFAPLLLILFRQKYPRWWFDWNLELQRFGNRVGAYLALMDNRVPLGLFDFVEGVLRWHNRVLASAWVLVTDRYPPFRLAS